MRAILFILAILLLPFASALYADIAVDIASDGHTTITGTTNVPGVVGESNAYTAKEGELWLFNITTPILDTFVYRILLPEGAQITYVAGKNARITTNGNGVEIRGSGENAPMTLTVQYTIAPTTKSFAWLPLLAVIFLLALLWGIMRKRRTQIQKSAPMPARQEKTPTYIDGIPQRQQAMVTLLRKADGTLTQRQIELTMKLPKSSVSRNVEALRRRGIIEKAQLGMTNTLVLAEKYR